MVTRVNREAIINTTATMRYGGRTFSVTLSGGDGVEDVTAIDTVEVYSVLGIVEASDIKGRERK